MLLLDEPLGALDLKLREQMQVELKAIQREVGITFVFVTHDQEEALTMSDRIAVFNEGRIEQVGTPAEVYEQPATRFVAGFVGTSNLLRGEAAAAVLGRDGRVQRAAREDPPRRRRGRGRRRRGHARSGTVREVVYVGLGHPVRRRPRRPAARSWPASRTSDRPRMDVAACADAGAPASGARVPRRDPRSARIARPPPHVPRSGAVGHQRKEEAVRSKRLLATAPALPPSVARIACGGSSSSTARLGRFHGARRYAGPVGAGEGTVNVLAWPGYVEDGSTDPAVDWVTTSRRRPAARST